MRTRSRGVAHGLTYSRKREYSAWLSAKTRCYNPNYHNYALYGGRGIAMSDEWRTDFPKFLADLGSCPPGHSLDRIDSDGPYVAGNCRWATNTQQLRNRRDNRRLTHNGETLTMGEWAERLGIHRRTLHARLTQGWAVERALTEPLAR